MGTFLLTIGGLVGFAALVVISAIWSGYVLALLWLWFVVPVFGLPILGLAQAIGFSLTVRFLTSQMGPKPEAEGYMTRCIAHMALFPLVALGVGYVVKGFL